MPRDELPGQLARDVEAHVRASFQRQGLMHHLGARITHLQRGRCELRVPFGPHVSQQHGYFHAGVTSALCDTAGGYAALSVFAATDSVLTVEFSVNLLAPATGAELVAAAHVVRSGRTLTVCAFDAHTSGGDGATHVATGKQTLFRLLDTPDGA